MFSYNFTSEKFLPLTFISLTKILSIQTRLLILEAFFKDTLTFNILPLLTIGNITASFVLGNTGDKICISGRSIGDVNVQMILEKLGGGGHITLAGAQLENTTIEEAKEKLISKIEEYFSEKE